MGPTAHSTIVLYNNFKLREVIRLYGCQDDSMTLPTHSLLPDKIYIHVHIQIHVQKYVTRTTSNNSFFFSYFYICQRRILN